MILYCKLTPIKIWNKNQDDNEITRVAVRFADEDLWLTQSQLAEIYCTSRENITMHIKNIYADEELLLDSTSKDSY